MEEKTKHGVTENRHGVQWSYVNTANSVNFLDGNVNKK